jgi:hypothetical protein
MEKGDSNQNVATNITPRLTTNDVKKLELLWQIIADDGKDKSVYDLALRVRSVIELFAEYPAFCAYIQVIIEQEAVIIGGGADDFAQAVA